MQRRQGNMTARVPLAIAGHKAEREDEDSLGTQFEVRRRSTRFGLGQYLKFYRPQYRIGAGFDWSSIPPGALSRERPIADSHAASFAVAYESLECDLNSLYALLQEIQHTEWSFERFPYIPNCLLYSLSFGIGQGLAMRRENKTLSTVLAIGLGITLAWTTYRALRFGTIWWCNHSLASLLSKLECDKLSKRDAEALDGVRWRFLFWINIML